MLILNTLVQLVGLGGAIYLAFSRSLFRGVLLLVIVGVLHFVVSQLSNLLMFLHQKTLSEEKLRDLTWRARIEGLAAAPVAWRTINTACGVLFFCLAAGTIWLFLNG